MSEPIAKQNERCLVEDDQGTLHAAVFRAGVWWEGYSPNVQIERPIVRIEAREQSQ